MTDNSDERQVPVIPPPGERLRVVIDSDAKCEIDDQWAIALAIMSPEKAYNYNVLSLGRLGSR